MSYELNLSNFRTAYITFVFIGIYLVSFIVLNVILGPFYLLVFAQDNYAIMDGEKIYTLFSAMFVHADLTHLISNLVALLIFGAMMEKYYGHFQFVLIYLLSGITGNICMFIFRGNTFTESLGLGASGAIYGIIAASILIIPRKNQFILILAGIYLVYSFITSFSPGIGTWAHIFGFITGFLLAFIINFIQYRKFGKNLVDGSFFTNIIDGISRLRWQIVIFFRNLFNSFKYKKKLNFSSSNKTELDSETQLIEKNESDDQHKETYEKNLLIRFKKVMEAELKVRMDRLAAELGISQTDLLERLIIWREVLPFQMKGEWVEIANISDFRNAFDQQLKAWIED